MASTKDFHGRWALVTGASAGIGVELARELAKHGAKLILTARRKDRLNALATSLATQGNEVRTVAADLNEPSAPQQIFEVTEGAGVPVDILIDNAGLGQFGAFHTNSIEQELSQQLRAAHGAGEEPVQRVRMSNLVAYCDSEERASEAKPSGRA